ncbi:MAG: IS66 family transposase [Planctomycetes bacterium]|nr:IS66 family transposase [Planctomycetota bacterium]
MTATSKRRDDDPDPLRARIRELEAHVSVLEARKTELEVQRTALEHRKTELEAQQAQLLETNEHLARLVAQFRRMLFGRRRERFANDEHPHLPFEIEDPPPPIPPHVEEAPDDESDAVQHNPRRRGVGRQRSDLPRVREVIEVPEQDRLCPCCRKPMQPIGETVTEELDYQPAVLRVREIVRVKYACREHEEAGVAQPELPARPIAKGIAAPSLIAQVVVAKYKDHLPLYRQSKIFARFGVDVPESTLGDWIQAAAQLLEPVVLAIKASLLESFVIHSDDTGILVQDRNHQNGSRRGHLWAYVGDRNEVVFDYTPGRSRDGPVRFLGDYRGHLHVDACSAYDAVLHKGTIVEVGCWAHARRYFFEALDTAKEHAGDALAAIRLLYDVEREAKERDLDAGAIQLLRQARSKPVLEPMLPWLQALRSTVLPKSPLGEAIRYALNQWQALNRYLEDGRLAIDNNIVERQLRGVAVGRKNWLFAGSDEGARRAAVLYSIVSTCSLQGVEPWAYLSDVLQRLANGADPATLTPRVWKTARPSVALV